MIRKAFALYSLLLIAPVMGLVDVHVLNQGVQSQALIYGFTSEPAFDASNFKLELYNATGSLVVLNSFNYYSDQGYDSIVSQGLFVASFNAAAYGNGTYIAKVFNATNLLRVQELSVNLSSSSISDTCSFDSVLDDNGLKGTIAYTVPNISGHYNLLFYKINSGTVSYVGSLEPLPVPVSSPVLQYFDFPSAGFSNGANLFLARLNATSSQSSFCVFALTKPVAATIFDASVSIDSYRLWEGEGGVIPVKVSNNGYLTDLKLVVEGSLVDTGKAFFLPGSVEKTFSLPKAAFDLKVSGIGPGIYPVSFKIFKDSNLLTSLASSVVVSKNESVSISGLQSSYELSEGTASTVFTLSNLGKSGSFDLRVLNPDGSNSTISFVQQAQSRLSLGTGDVAQVALNFNLANPNVLKHQFFKVYNGSSEVYSAEFSVVRKNYSISVDLPEMIFLNGNGSSEKFFTIRNTGSPALISASLTSPFYPNVSLISSSLTIGSNASAQLGLRFNLSSQPSSNEFTLSFYAGSGLLYSKTVKVFLDGNPGVLLSASDSYTVRRDRNDTVLVAIKNFGSRTTYDLELSDVSGDLASFNDAVLQSLKMTLEQGSKDIVKILVRVPNDFDASSASLLLSVKAYGQIIGQARIRLDVADRGVIHSLLIEDYSFDSDKYLPGSSGLLTFTVRNNGDFAEKVSGGISFDDRVVKSPLLKTIPVSSSQSFSLPFIVSERVSSDFKLAITAESDSLVESESALVPVLIPFHSFSVGSSNSSLIVSDGEEVSLNFFVSNFGNLPESFTLSSKSYPVALSSDSVTINPVSVSSLKADLRVDYSILDSIVIEACSVDTGECNSLSIKLVPKSVSQKGSLEVSVNDSMKKVSSLGSAVYKVLLTNSFASAREVVLSLDSDNSFNASIYPSSTIVLPASSSKEVYVYALALKSTLAGVHEFSLKASSGGEKLFEENLSFEVEASRITGFAALVLNPLTYLILLVFAVGVAGVFFARKKFGGGAYYEYQNYY